MTKIKFDCRMEPGSYWPWPMIGVNYPMKETFNRTCSTKYMYGWESIRWYRRMWNWFKSLFGYKTFNKENYKRESTLNE